MSLVAGPLQVTNVWRLTQKLFQATDDREVPEKKARKKMMWRRNEGQGKESRPQLTAVDCESQRVTLPSLSLPSLSLSVPQMFEPSSFENLQLITFEKSSFFSIISFKRSPLEEVAPPLAVQFRDERKTEFRTTFFYFSSCLFFSPSLFHRYSPS